MVVLVSHNITDMFLTCLNVVLNKFCLVLFLWTQTKKLIIIGGLVLATESSVKDKNISFAILVS